MIQIPKTLLILGYENNMVGSAGKNHAFGTLAHEIPVHLLQPGQSPVPEHGYQLAEDQTADIGIVRCPMVIKIGQLQLLCDNIQLEPVQMGQQLLMLEQLLRQKIL